MDGELAREERVDSSETCAEDFCEIAIEDVLGEEQLGVCERVRLGRILSGREGNVCTSEVGRPTVSFVCTTADHG